MFYRSVFQRSEKKPKELYELFYKVFYLFGDRVAVSAPGGVDVESSRDGRAPALVARCPLGCRQAGGPRRAEAQPAGIHALAACKGTETRRRIACRCARVFEVIKRRWIDVRASRQPFFVRDLQPVVAGASNADILEMETFLSLADCRF